MRNSLLGWQFVAGERNANGSMFYFRFVVFFSLALCIDGEEVLVSSSRHNMCMDISQHGIPMENNKKNKKNRDRAFRTFMDVYGILESRRSLTTTRWFLSFILLLCAR